jgi:hypothetical protein
MRTRGIPEGVSERGLVSPRAPIRRLNAICPYYTMFPLDFPLNVLRHGSQRDRVLDPFAGRGTTLYAARLLGLQAVGIDSNPVAAAASAAKLVSVTPTSVIECAQELLDATKPVQVPEGRFWQLAYSRATLIEICRLREGLLKREDPSSVALRALTMGLLHGPLRVGEPSYFSNQMPRTYATKPAAAVRYWTARGMRPPYVSAADLIARKAKWFFESVPPPTGGSVVLGDAAQTLKRSWQPFNLIVTSPPYPGMRTYRPDQWIRNWFLGGPPTVDYSEPDQLGGSSLTEFTSALADVWKRAAARCVPGARLVVRFGGLPSLDYVAPRELLLKTLRDAGGWRVTTVRGVDGPRPGRRQASQFGVRGSGSVEIDCYARLES